MTVCFFLQYLVLKQTKTILALIRGTDKLEGKMYDSDGFNNLVFDSHPLSYSPVTLFTEHWLFFLFLFGPLSHLREQNRGERETTKKNQKIIIKK